MTEKNESIFGAEHDHRYMREALACARDAALREEVPIGAIVVDASGTIIGVGSNKTEQEKTQRAHAEMYAIEQACKQKGDWRLEGCWLYVTLEPCMMCMGLVLLSRFQGVVFGASSPLFGYRLDNYELSPVYKGDTITVIKGVGAEEAADMLRQFFKKRRDEAWPK